MGVLHFIRFFEGFLFIFFFFFEKENGGFSFLPPSGLLSASVAISVWALSTMSSMSCIVSHFVEAVKIPNLVEGPNLALHLAPNREIHGEITYSMWMRLDKKKKKKEKKKNRKRGKEKTWMLNYTTRCIFSNEKISWLEWDDATFNSKY